MLNLSSTNKFQITLLVLIAIVYLYRTNNHHEDFAGQIPSDVNKCMDSKIVKLLSSDESDNDLVDAALSSCSSVVDPWLKSITISDEEYGMTMSYLKSHYMSEIKYSRQPKADGWGLLI